jgi:hypothetical protein
MTSATESQRWDSGPKSTPRSSADASGTVTIATTLDTYTHAATEVERAAAAKIAALVDARSEA